MASAHPPDEPAVRVVRHSHDIAPRALVSLLAAAGGVWLLMRLWPVIIMLVVALILAATLNPAVSWLERRRLPRPFALGAVFLALLLAVVALATLLVPALARQVVDLIAAAPALQAQLADYAAGIPALAGRADAIRLADPERLLAPLGASALTYAAMAARLALLGVTVLTLSFYLIADRERAQGFAFALLPRRYHVRAARVLLDLGVVVGGYMRGQALTSLFIGAFSFVTLAALGVPNALALAAFAALADLIPFVGAWLAVVPPALAALSRGPGVAIVVLIALVSYQQVESHVLIPRVYGQALRLPPLAVLVALLVGGQLQGVAGALLALPVAAGLRVLIEQLRVDLPGDQPGEGVQHAADARAEADYATQAAGAPAVEAAAIAVALAEEQQGAASAATGWAPLPVEEHEDAPCSPPARGQ